MTNGETITKKNKGFYLYTIQVLVSILFISPAYFIAHGQNCPANIDFEKGNFTGWDCYIGSVAATGGQNVISLSSIGGPATDQHTMYDALNLSNATDPYGGFPVTCPNGSRYSIRLGNDQGGGQAEGISYTFTIPANKNFYSLIYHYAVVFQEPGHLEHEQPRMEIEIMNLTDNNIISCASFTFIAYGNILPGFFQSPNPGTSTPVWCKDWSAASINLDGNAGKTIRLSFKTADCTFRRHFGYAYIDVNTECSGEFTGAAYCRDDTAVSVVAPYGYQSYTWYNNTFTQVMGNQQTIRLSPPPPPGTALAVVVVPYDGFGCLDTLYANMIDTLKVTAYAGADGLSCNQNPVPIGTIPKPGIIYRWSPATGLSNPNIANPFAKPDVTTQYILTTRSPGGGCLTSDTVLVRASVIGNAMELLGKNAFCTDSEDSAVLRVQQTDSIQWFRDGKAIAGATKREYRVVQSGSYNAMLFKKDGCFISTASQTILIEEPKPGVRYKDQFAVINFPVTLNARPFGETFVWSPPLYLNDPASVSPVFKGAAEQQYSIIITTEVGCVTVDTQLVKTVKSVEIYVPSAFTPNNDGLNDLLKPILRGVKELHYFRIYNRWGQLLFETKNDGQGWNGLLGGALQSSQVFVWVAEALGLDGVIHHRKGTCTLIR